LLDVLRSPHRDGVPSGIIEATVALSTRASATPRQAWVVAAEQMHHEWTEHVANVEQETRAEIDKLARRLAALRAVTQALPAGPLARVDLIPLDLPTQLRAVAQGLLDCAQLISQDGARVQSAWARVRDGVPPASKGKQEMKDCVIFEHYLALSRRLRGAGFVPALVFVSSNTTDYGSPGHLSPFLEGDLAASLLQYVTNFAWAVTLL